MPLSSYSPAKPPSATSGSTSETGEHILPAGIGSAYHWWEDGWEALGLKLLLVLLGLGLVFPFAAVSSASAMGPILGVSEVTHVCDADLG